MFKKSLILRIFFLLCSFCCFSQKDTVKIVPSNRIISLNKVYNPLAPSKAAFYSAVFPGGGQMFNKKYWKVPLAWAAVGIPTYFYLDNNTEYKRYRTAYKQRRKRFLIYSSLNRSANCSVKAPPSCSASVKVIALL